MKCTYVHQFFYLNMNLPWIPDCHRILKLYGFMSLEILFNNVLVFTYNCDCKYLRNCDDWNLLVLAANSQRETLSHLQNLLKHLIIVYDPRMKNIRKYYFSISANYYLNIKDKKRSSKHELNKNRINHSNSIELNFRLSFPLVSILILQ